MERGLRHETIAMRTHHVSIRILSIAVGMGFGLSAVGSELTLTTEYHYVARSDRTPMSVVFADERLIANVKLDVYALPHRPKTRLLNAELTKLNETSWLSEMEWTLVDAAGRPVPLPTPIVRQNTVRHRGPNAALERDRDTTVECTSYQARLDFGPVPVGDLTLQVRLLGLDRSFPIAVRTGEESEVRDAYLETRASRASSFQEFRELQLERYHDDPSHIEPIFLALDRALTQGSLEDAGSLLALGIERIDERRRKATSAQRRFFEDRSRELRQLQVMLESYFKHRDKWTIVRDIEKGGYVIRDRRSGRLIRDFTKPEP
jgi:hypothetical protein